MNLDLLSKLVTLAVFGAIGWAVARTWSVPARSSTWLLLALGTVAGTFIGVNTNVVCLNGIGICMPLNWAIASCCLGMLVGLGARALASRRGGQS